MQTAKRFTALLFTSLAVMTTATDKLPTLGDIAFIQAETLLTKAQIKREEARNELTLKRAFGSGSDGTLPVVKSILGTAQQTVATLIYPGNIKVEAIVGDILPGGYKLSKIFQASNKVELTKGKQHYTVGVSSVTPSNKSQESGNPMQVPALHLPGNFK